VADEDVPELRELVQAVLADDAADARDARVVRELVELLVLGAELGVALEDRLEARLAVAVHAAEFRGAEALAVAAEALLEVEDRPLGVEFDGEAQEPDDRQDDEAAEARERDVHEALHHPRAREQELLPELDAEDAADVLGGDAEA